MPLPLGQLPTLPARLPEGFLRSLTSSFIKPLATFLRLQGLALLALPFLLIRMPPGLKLPKWVGYAIYPAHLLLLWGLETRLL